MLKGVRDDRESALCMDRVHRRVKILRFNRARHKKPQQVSAPGRDLGRGNDEKIVVFRNFLQYSVVVADGNTIQPALTREGNDLAQAHAAVERPLGMNVQIEPQLHALLPFLSARKGFF